MSLAFLTPLALAAAALVAVPWLLHHIRRPERRPVRFSSLMFVPEIKKEVIERRRLQHWLLMLLRMLILVLLACAFARPYVPILAGARPPAGSERHAILLDVSYSMGASGYFDAAKEAARRIIHGLEDGDRVAVIVFAQAPQVLAPLGNAGDALAAIDGAALTSQSTDYEAALRRAVEVLSSESPEAEAPQLHLHLLTDFQHRGMPERATGWRLPSQVVFHPVEIGKPGANRAVTDLAVTEPKPGQLQLRAKVRNWSREAGPVTLRLLTGGQVRETRQADVAPGNASQVAFEYAAADDALVTGWIEVEDAALPADNRRFFTRNPERKQQVLVVDAAPASARWPAARLLEYALPDTPDTPWAARTVAEPNDTDLAAADLVIVSGPVSDALGSRLLSYVSKGGGILLCLGEPAAAGASDAALLQALGLVSKGMRHADLQDGRFTLLSWIDFEHPVFQPFTDPRYNDFSDVRFSNHRLLDLLPVPDGAIAPRVLARFEASEGDQGLPAVVEVAYGTGRALVWAFPVDLQWTSLPKTPRFVPLLHESLTFLGGARESERVWRVGETLVPPRQGAAPQRLLAETLAPASGPASPVDAPGFIEWRGPGAAEALRVDAANLPPEEGDPSRITPAEFALRLCSNPTGTAASSLEAPGSRQAGSEQTLEYGRYVLAFILMALFTESWYASRLASFAPIKPTSD